MYQFTTTTVINSNLDSNGTSAKYTGTANSFHVTRVNTFKKDGIVSVTKRPYEAGVKEQAQVTVPVIEAGRVARIAVDVRLSQKTDSEYASTYLYFKKPVEVEVIATGVAADDAAALVKQLNGLKDRFGFNYFSASAAGAVITLVAINNYQRFFSAKILKEIVPLYANTKIQPEYEDVTAGTFAVTVKGKVGFGDEDHMIRSVMVPTYENTRFFGINKEERPIIGGNYTEFVLRYSIEKSDDGIVAGQKSITNHVFFVKSDLVAAFEAEINKVFPAIQTLGGVGSIKIVGDDLLDLSNGDTTTLVAKGFSGSVTWTSGTVGTATIGASTGIVTPVAAGTTTITATDSLGATGTFLLTVVA